MPPAPPRRRPRARRARAAAVAVVAALGGGCADDGVTVVTVSSRPAVRPVEELAVTLSNANATLVERFAVDGRAFPLTFSIETGGRDGVLELHADAFDGAGAAVGIGAATVALGGRTDVDLMLEPTDFVVNTVFVGDQALAFRPDAGGRQLAVGADGVITTGWTDSCSVVGRCDVFGRRFDATGQAVTSALAAGTAQFNFNRTNNIIGYEPSLATNAAGATLAVWSDGGELMAVTIDAAGAATAITETIVASGTAPTTPAVAALPGGRFVVAWTELAMAGQYQVRAIWLDDRAQPVLNPVTGSVAPYTASTVNLGDPAPPAVVALGDGAAHGIAWRNGSILRGRFYTSAGMPRAAADVSIGTFGADLIGEVQLAPAGPDVAVLFSRRTSGGDADDGQLVLRRITPAGARTGVDAIVARGVTTIRPMALAGRADGALAVAWEACAEDGDGAGCAIRTQLFRPNLAAVGAPALTNTTTAGNQIEPSLAALPGGELFVMWSDGSAAAPDTDGFSIRARVLYPAYDDVRGLGARCTSSAACGDGNVCMPGSDATPRCYRACAGDRSCLYGGSCTTIGDESGCLF